MTLLIEVTTLPGPDNVGWLGCDLPDECIDEVVQEFVGAQEDGTPHEWRRLEAEMSGRLTAEPGTLVHAAASSWNVCLWLVQPQS